MILKMVEGVEYVSLKAVLVSTNIESSKYFHLALICDSYSLAGSRLCVGNELKVRLWHCESSPRLD